MRFSDRDKPFHLIACGDDQQTLAELGGADLLRALRQRDKRLQGSFISNCPPKAAAIQLKGVMTRTMLPRVDRTRPMGSKEVPVSMR
jgi:hypothetical protein